MGYIADIYPAEQTSPTMTDRYHFTTGYGYWLEGRAGNPAVFYVFGRKPAEGAGYTAAVGLEGVIDIVKRWQDHGLTNDDLNWLKEEGYPDGYIEYLRYAKWKLEIDAAPEGTVFFPQEPILRIKGSMAQAKVLESLALCILNGQSGYGTHAAHMADVLEEELDSNAPIGAASVQGLRRGPAVGAVLEASRGLAAGGYKSTSTGRAAEMFGIKFAGTMDHAWVESHEHQLNHSGPTMKELFAMAKEGRTAELQEALSKDAFRSYAFANPNGIFLTDTYDTVQGIEDAITVIKELRELGLGKNYGMRFDSGDLTEFSKIALRRLAERNENGDLLDALPDGTDIGGLSNRDLLIYARESMDVPFCSASDGITVYTAQKMREDGAYIRSWGVGTAGSHVPPLGLVQKLAAFYMEPLNGAPMPDDEALTPLMKIVSAAPQKSSNPGIINSRRFFGTDGKLSHVVVYDESLGFDPDGAIVNLRDFSDKKTSSKGTKFEDILQPVFDAKGQYVFQEPPKKPAHSGSSHMVTDLDHIAHTIKGNLDALPNDVRRVQRPRKDVLADLLVQAYEAASRKGAETLHLDLADIEEKLPPPQAHIPVYLDGLLFEQRMVCENKHVQESSGACQSVGMYVERFEQG
jgi:nicotinate phosphoribosyltransferase